MTPDTTRPAVVLLVEDEPAHAELIERVFEARREAIQVVLAASLAEARQVLSRHRPALILTDWLLPDGLGIDLLPAAPEETAAPVVIMTSHGNERVAVEAMKAGALDYVVKSEATLADMPHIAERAMREWAHVVERRRAEAARLESELRLRRITDNMRDVITQIDPQGIIEYASPSCRTVLGYRPEALLGRFVFEHVHSDDRDGTIAALRAGWPEQSIPRLEFRYQHADGHYIWLEAVGTRLRGEHGDTESTILTSRDITQRKHLEDQLSQSHKLQALGQLAGGVAHDFNNLLTVITGYSDLLMDAARGDLATIAYDVEQIREACRRAASMTRQLLAFSRRQVLDLRVLDLNGVITGVTQLLRRLIGEDVELVTMLDPAACRVRADAGQLEQILMNLAVNARDAMPHGGTLLIETQNIYLDEAYARQHLELTPGQFVQLDVTDTGHGMDAQTLAHIFEPFFTTKEPGRGTGLGLATVHGIVKQFGGHIWAYSEPGHGTTFKILLPRVVTGDGDSYQEGQLASPPHGQETILLVEDDAAVRRLARRILERHGYNVLEADGDEAVVISAQYQAEIHLLLTDVVMPRISGRELADRLALDRPAMKVLYMSGYTEHTIVQRGVIQEGQFLAKPFTPGSLTHSVRLALDGGAR